MTGRRFPPPWTVEETAPCFIIRDANDHALPDRRLWGLPDELVSLLDYRRCQQALGTETPICTGASDA